MVKQAANGLLALGRKVLFLAAFAAASGTFGYLLGAADGWMILVGEGEAPAAHVAGMAHLGVPLRRILVPGPVPEAPPLGALVAAALGPACFFGILGGRLSRRELAGGLLGISAVSLGWAWAFGVTTAILTPVALVAIAAVVRVSREGPHA
ncbi:MAG TPA: hypothetical protein VMK66_21380 [Myxococcales bacterium]|nr:hypothetical protein [Myxococcales bacterium]